MRRFFGNRLAQKRAKVLFGLIGCQREAWTAARLRAVEPVQFGADIAGLGPGSGGGPKLSGKAAKYGVAALGNQ